MVQITKRREQNIKSAICTNIKQRVSVSHRTRHFGDKSAKNGPNHNKIVHFGPLGIKCSALQWRRNKGSGSFPMGLSTLATWAKIKMIDHSQDEQRSNTMHFWFNYSLRVYQFLSDPGIPGVRSMGPSL